MPIKYMKENTFFFYVKWSEKNKDDSISLMINFLVEILSSSESDTLYIINSFELSIKLFGWQLRNQIL